MQWFVKNKNKIRNVLANQMVTTNHSLKQNVFLMRGRIFRESKLGSELWSFKHQNSTQTHMHTRREKRNHCRLSYQNGILSINPGPVSVGRGGMHIMTLKHSAITSSMYVQEHACQQINKVPMERRICAWLMMLWRRPIVGNATKQTLLNMMRVSPSALINIYKWNVHFFWPCALKMHLHYIQTSWCLCVHGVAVIRTFTSLHTPFT